MRHNIAPTLFSPESLQFISVFVKYSIKNTGSARQALLNISSIRYIKAVIFCDYYSILNFPPNLQSILYSFSHVTITHKCCYKKLTQRVINHSRLLAQSWSAGNYSAIIYERKRSFFVTRRYHS